MTVAALPTCCFRGRFVVGTPEASQGPSKIDLSVKSPWPRTSRFYCLRALPTCCLRRQFLILGTFDSVYGSRHERLRPLKGRPLDKSINWNTSKKPSAAQEPSKDAHRRIDFAFLADHISAQSGDSGRLIERKSMSGRNLQTVKRDGMKNETRTVNGDFEHSVLKQTGPKRMLSVEKERSMAMDTDINNIERLTASNIIASERKAPANLVNRWVKTGADFCRVSPQHVPDKERSQLEMGNSHEDEADASSSPPHSPSTMSKGSMTLNSNDISATKSNAHSAKLYDDDASLSPLPKASVGDPRLYDNDACAMRSSVGSVSVNGHDSPMSTSSPQSPTSKRLVATASLYSNDASASSLSTKTSSTRGSVGIAVASDQKQPLTGQDVLFALERATLERAKRKQSSTKASARSSRAKEGSLPQADCVDWKNVRPIILKSDWASQIEDLEKRIVELKEDIRV